MIKGTIKDYTITSLWNIIAYFIRLKGKPTSSGTTGDILSLDLDLHTSTGLHILNLTATYKTDSYGTSHPYKIFVTYTTQVHPDPIRKDLQQLTKPNLWDIAYIISDT